MTTPKPWHEHAARTIERERRKERHWVWTADRDASPEQVQRAKHILARATQSTVMIEGVVWKRVDLS